MNNSPNRVAHIRTIEEEAAEQQERLNQYAASNEAEVEKKAAKNNQSTAQL
jgi:hypothetical protein